jgi:hypothetical protein
LDKPLDKPLDFVRIFVPCVRKMLLSGIFGSTLDSDDQQFGPSTLELLDLSQHCDQTLDHQTFELLDLSQHCDQTLDHQTFIPLLYKCICIHCGSHDIKILTIL